MAYQNLFQYQDVQETSTTGQINALSQDTHNLIGGKHKNRFGYRNISKQINFSLLHIIHDHLRFDSSHVWMSYDGQ